jgi:hypothetical protein
VESEQPYEHLGPLGPRLRHGDGGECLFSDPGCTQPLVNVAKGCAPQIYAYQGVTAACAANSYRIFQVGAAYTGMLYTGTPASCTAERDAGADNLRSSVRNLLARARGRAKHVRGGDGSNGPVSCDAALTRTLRRPGVGGHLDPGKSDHPSPGRRQRASSARRRGTSNAGLGKVVATNRQHHFDHRAGNHFAGSVGGASVGVGPESSEASGTSAR